jgi:hypothetical protein
LSSIIQKCPVSCLREGRERGTHTLTTRAYDALSECDSAGIRGDSPLSRDTPAWYRCHRISRSTFPSAGKGVCMAIHGPPNGLAARIIPTPASHPIRSRGTSRSLNVSASFVILSRYFQEYEFPFVPNQLMVPHLPRPHISPLRPPDNPFLQMHRLEEGFPGSIKLPAANVLRRLMSKTRERPTRERRSVIHRYPFNRAVRKDAMNPGTGKNRFPPVARYFRGLGIGPGSASGFAYDVISKILLQKLSLLVRV